MKNYEESVEINPNSYWSYIPNYCYKTLIIDGSGSGETNGLLNVIKLQQPNIEKIYLYVNDPFESKYPLFINGREKARKKKLETEKTFINYSQIFDGVYENAENHNLWKKRKCYQCFTIY